MVPKRFRDLSVPGGYRNPPGKLMGLMGHSGEEEAGQGEVAPPPMGPNWLGEGGDAPLAFSYSLSLFLFPSLLLRKGKEFLLGLGSPSRTPYTWRAPRGPASLPPSFIHVGRGHPKGTPRFVLAVCGAPLHSYTPRSYHRSA